MTGPGITNTTGPEANVGIQADQVHNSTVYQVHSQAPPHRRYETGLRFLEIGVPSQARELIGEAVAHGYDGSEVRFHWVLAQLSKRSYRDLTAEECEQLNRTAAALHRYPDDEWKRALEAIFELLGCLDGSEAGTDLAISELRALPSHQKGKITRHLHLVLTSGMTESLWAETRRAAEEARFSNDRSNRVWAYFVPDPADPRAREPAANAATLGDHVQAIAWTGLFAVAVGYLGWSVLVSVQVGSILAYLLALAAGYAAARNGAYWHYMAKRIREKDREFTAPHSSTSPPEEGFANRVDNTFTRYFTKYAPKDADRVRWFADTAGIRRTLRNEVVEIYREKRISAESIRWLIRYMVHDVKERWRAGTLLEYRDQYRTAASTKIVTVLSLAALVAASAVVAAAAFLESPINTVLAVLAIVASGRFAAPLWLLIAGERRRVEEDEREHERILWERRAEYLRWKEKLEATRPSEPEMEAWLDADKMRILDDALRHYRLAWHGTIAHAFLHTPERPCKRARTSRGPWRYSKYEIRVFLITKDGVREVVANLDFERAEVTSYERDNFRFEAVSSVQVEEGTLGYTLNLTLMNGPTKSVVVTEAEPHQSDSDEDSSELFRLNLDASGFAHTLRILEGIAAEGKTWIDRDRVLDVGDHRLPVDSLDPAEPREDTTGATTQ